MRLRHPRIPPLEADEWSEEAATILAPLTADRRDLNIFKTMANHPALLRRWLVFGQHILAESTLPDRVRELVILRIGWRCRSRYEWGQHVLLARPVGLSDDDIRRIQSGPDAPGWDDLDRLLLTATDQLHDDSFVADETWAGLAEHLSTEQLMDLVFTVGQYSLVSMALNTFGVQSDEGLPGWDV